ncbi:MAG TPA: thiol reductant ABC exporter subunit CydC [Dermatophilaceae bacterium]|nr:thiol reductant ABC exporter subunit CydC [Dermatophilaceae bacterium]
MSATEPAGAKAGRAAYLSSAEEVLSTRAPGVRRAALIGGLASASGIALTATAGWLIVAASHRPVILTLLAVIVGVRAFGIARPVLRYVERVRSHDAALDLLARRRVAAYRALIPLTPARLGRRSRATVLTSAVDDLEDLVFAQVRVVVPVLGSVVAGLLTVVILGLLVPAGGLVVLAVLVGHALVAWLDRRLELGAQQEWLTARADVARVSALVTSYAAELHGAEAGPHAVEWVRDAHARLASATRRLARARAIGVALGLLVTGGGTVLAALVAQWAMSVGLPDAIAAIVVLAPLAVGDALVGLPDAMGAWARARGSERRLQELLDQSPAVVDTEDPALDTPPSPGADVDAGPAHRFREGSGFSRGVGVGLEGVGAAWGEGRGARLDLAPVDLRVEPGEQVVLTGSNGSGKSTLLAVLARQLDPASGRYRLGGVDVRTLPLAEARGRIAVVDDEPHIFASSLRENLRLARPGCPDEPLLDALRSAGLADWYAALPDGLDSMLGTGGRGVSGGERARLALARAHLSERPLVLLDEPVAHLDHATAVAVLADVQRGLAGRTVVLVSHRPDGVDAFDRVIDLAELQRVAQPRGIPDDRHAQESSP